jgi:hypothetical protein
MLKQFNNFIREHQIIQSVSGLVEEALQPSTAKKFMNIEKNENIIQVQNQIWDKLLQHENLIDSSKRNDRLYFYLDDSNKVEYSNIKYALEKYLLPEFNYVIQDYQKGLIQHQDTNQIMKIGKFLNKTSKDAEKGKLTSNQNIAIMNSANELALLNGVAEFERAEINDYINYLINSFDSDPAREGSQVKDDTLIVFSRHSYDIAGMSTDRGWSSCMNLAQGSNANYVGKDIEHGVFIAYAVKSDDKNINNPLARVLIKPFVNVGDENKIIYLPEKQVYPKDILGFSDKVFEILNSVHDTLQPGKYNIQHDLYCDTKQSVFNITRNLQRAIQKLDVNSSRITDNQLINDLFEALNNINPLQLDFNINSDSSVDIVAGTDVVSDKWFEGLISELRGLKIEKQDYLFPVNINYVNATYLSYESLPFTTKHLKGAPNEVRKNFRLDTYRQTSRRSSNSDEAEEAEIEDLSGCPQIVPGIYRIHTNKIKSLENTPDEVYSLVIKAEVENLDINHFPKLTELEINKDYINISSLQKYLSETSKGEREKSLQDFEFEFKPQLESGELITNPEHIETLLSEETSMIDYDREGTKINVTPNNDGSVNLSIDKMTNLDIKIDNSAYNKLPFNINKLDNFISLSVSNGKSQDLQSLEEFPSSVNRMIITAKSMPNNVPESSRYILNITQPIENFDYFPDEIDSFEIQSYLPIPSLKNLPVINEELELSCYFNDEDFEHNSEAIEESGIDINISETIEMEDFLEIIKNKTESTYRVHIDKEYALLIYQYHTGLFDSTGFIDECRNEIGDKFRSNN